MIFLSDLLWGKPVLHQHLITTELGASAAQGSSDISLDESISTENPCKVLKTALFLVLEVKQEVRTKENSLTRWYLPFAYLCNRFLKLSL